MLADNFAFGPTVKIWSFLAADDECGNITNVEAFQARNQLTRKTVSVTLQVRHKVDFVLLCFWAPIKLFTGNLLKLMHWMVNTGISGACKKMKGYRYIFRHICTSFKNNKHLKFSLCKNGKTNLTRRFTLETYNVLWTYKRTKMNCAWLMCSTNSMKSMNSL